MAQKILKTIVQLRRDTELNYIKIKDAFIPLKGEVLLVDTVKDGLRAKVGDGISTYAQLEYTDTNIYNAIDTAVNTVVMRGYYLNGKFYTSSTYTEELPKSINRLYIDINSNVIYSFNGSAFISINDTLPTASDAVAGISKLYNEAGHNTDGSMTQNSITTGVNSIELSIDDKDPECLVLDLPWINV